MSIAIKITKTAQIRRLHAAGLSAEDIVKVAGYPSSIVRNALIVKRAFVK